MSGIFGSLMNMIGASQGSQDTGIVQFGLPSQNLTQLPQDRKNEIGRLATLPNRVSGNDVVKSAEFALRAEGYAELMQKESQNRLQAMRALQRMYQVQAQHAAGTMQINNALQAIDSKHTRNVARHGLAGQIEAARATGYLGAYHSARQGINLQ